MMTIAIGTLAAAVFCASSPTSAPVRTDHARPQQVALRLQDLPAPAQKAFQDQANGGRVVEVRSTPAVYEGKVVKDGKEADVKVDSNGQVVSQGQARTQYKGYSGFPPFASLGR
jgi:hypothetical protein